ncbi:MAG: AMP-binding protein, partial [Bacteroidales bacterium]
MEEIFVTAWQGKENEDCIWWQGEWWTWNRLNDLALDCEEKLKNSGFTEGQRLILLLPNSPMVFALSIAAWRLGGAVAPLNMRTGLVNMFNTI